MTNHDLEKLLGLSSPPIAIGLLDEIPEGVARWEGGAACAVAPFALARKQPALSFCRKGNRTFSGMPVEEMYLSIPGEDRARLVVARDEADEANRAMGDRYTQRRSLFPILN